MSRPLILVVNDDGITSKGIRSLIEVARLHGDVFVVAPDSPQSGMGHAITLSSSLTAKPYEALDAGPEEYACSGTPADCVKLGIKHLMPRRPDLCISGINHGSNESCNVIYSGTMSAAIEACMEGIPSIGFSLRDFNPDADFTLAKQHATQIIEKVLHSSLDKGVCLNVNIPKGTEDDIHGIKVCRQSIGNYDEIIEPRKDPYGRTYYWLTGALQNMEPDATDTDSYWLEKGYTTIVPTQFDLTAHSALQSVSSWF